MNRISAYLFIVSFLAIGLSFQVPRDNFDANTKVYEALKSLGEAYPDHARPDATKEVIQRGKDLIHLGRTITEKGKKSKYISKFYVCTSCHSTVQEDPDLRFFDPEARLDYVAEIGQKFLQGSPFFGIVNRESWYNDDYVLKYGDLVKPANKSLAEAIQLCAKVCSSGRYLDDWELEAILAYYWEIQFTLGDLNLTEEDWKRLKSTSSNKEEMVKLIKSKYALKSPATFGELPEDSDKGYPYEGRAEKGKLIYEFSCQACHNELGVAGMTLAADKMTFRKFLNNLNKHSDYNLYEISRHGTYAAEGKPRYMPLYPKERLSDQQLEDLRAYMESEING